MLTRLFVELSTTFRFFFSAMSLLSIFAICGVVLHLITLLVEASPATVDGMSWSINPTEDDNWATRYYSGYRSLLSGLKDDHQSIYSELTSVLNGDSIPSTYDHNWVVSAESALVVWESTAFEPEQLGRNYEGLPIPTIVEELPTDDQEGNNGSSGGSISHVGLGEAVSESDASSRGHSILANIITANNGIGAYSILAVAIASTFL